MIDEGGLDLPSDFVRRMRNWARAAAGCAFGALRAADYGAVIEGGYRESTMPVLDGEASDTEAALATVGMRYQQAVRQYWAYEGRPWRWHGLRRNVNHETFRAWVMKGHDDLRIELARRTQVHHRVVLANASTRAVSPFNWRLTD